MRESFAAAWISACKLFSEFISALYDDLDNMLHLEPDDDHEDA